MKQLFKKTAAVLLSLTLFFLSGPHQVFAYEAEAANQLDQTAEVNISEPSNTDLGTANYSSELISAYKQLCQSIPANSSSVSISLETFANEFDPEVYPSLDKYLESYYQLISKTPNTDSRGTTSYWYYNTNGCTAIPNYSKYNLLSIVQPGDILFEETGGFCIQRHVAIVEGIYYDSYYQTFYIRLFEAIGPLSIADSTKDADGVCRGVLDDNRFDTNQGKILRVSGASSSQISNAISFCRNQIGDDYFLDFGKETDGSTQHWYSSELIWAAYYNQGIDLETSNSAAGIMPIEILNSTRTVEQSVTANLGAPTITSINISNQNTASIYWSSTINATSYSVYRATSQPTSNITLLTTTAYTYYHDYNLSPNKTYYYWIVANKSGTVTNRSPVKAIQTAFTYTSTSSCRATSNTSMELTWPQIYNAEKYDIYRAVGSNQNYTKIATVYTTAFSESGLTSGTKYFYKIQPVSYSGAVATAMYYSSVTPGVMRKPAFYYLCPVSEPEYISVLIKWTKIPEATSYRVYYSVGDSGVYTLFAQTDETECSHLFPEHEGTWHFRVAAVNSFGEGEWSNIISYSVTVED